MNRVASPSVLILSARFGSGHTSVSNALKSSFAASGVSNVTLEDFYELASPRYNRLSRFIYTNSITWTPRLYGAAYYSANAVSPDSAIYNISDRFGRERLSAYLRETAPDVVVCTYPTPAGVIADLKSKSLFDGLLVTVITDYQAHSGWINNGVDLYLIADEDIKKNLIRHGLDDSTIEITGIPIDPIFALKNKYVKPVDGLPFDKPIVLFIAHAYRPDQVVNITNALTHSVPEAHFAVLCGPRQSLINRLKSFETAGNVTLFDYVDRIDRLMASADVLVSKAGGITLTEALACRLPVVIYRPIPGQEKENARFLAGRNAVVVAQDVVELAREVKSLVVDKGRADMMRKAASEIVNSDSSYRAVQAILSRVAAGRPRPVLPV